MPDKFLRIPYRKEPRQADEKITEVIQLVTETLALILCAICILAVPYLAWLQARQFNIERKEWREERSKLLDRIQAGSFIEYKAQERAETPIKRKEKDPKKLEDEPWL